MKQGKEIEQTEIRKFKYKTRSRGDTVPRSSITLPEYGSLLRVLRSAAENRTHALTGIGTVNVCPHASEMSE
jgi:hypothetical protein